jgi:hypothetical protein
MANIGLKNMVLTDDLLQAPLDDLRPVRQALASRRLKRSDVGPGVVERPWL